jgi:peptide deformylase
MLERCASVPRLVADVGRAMEVIVSGFVPGTAKHVVFPANGIEASCIQHEIDHLDGMTFLERIVDPIGDVFVDGAHR